MVLFVCESKFQLLNAINISGSLVKDTIVDLCISDKLGYFEEMTDLVSKSKVFHNIYYFRPPYRPLQDFYSMVKKSFKAWNMDKFIRNAMPDLPICYEKVFISGSGLSCIGIYYYLRKYNKEIKLCLFEDGVCEYLCYTWNSNWYRRIYSRLFYGAYYLDDVSEMYVYAPELLIDKPKSITSYRIPILGNNNKSKNIINYIFGYNCHGLDILHSCKCLFIDVDFTDDYSSKCQYEIVDRLYSKLGKDLIVKIHPRSYKCKYDEIGVTCLDTSQIMELIMLNNSFENMVFISSISSAIFNLRNVFNVTPPLIILNSIFKTLNGRGVSLYVEKFKEIYPSDKIFQPSTIDELISIIDNHLS